MYGCNTEIFVFMEQLKRFRYFDNRIFLRKDKKASSPRKTGSENFEIELEIEAKEKDEEECLDIPKTHKIKSQVIGHRSGGRRKNLERDKRTENGLGILKIEASLSKASLYGAERGNDLQQRYSHFKEKMVIMSYKSESALTNCAQMKENHGVGSRIKEFLKYGGKRNSKKHSLYTSVCITNENNTSQNYSFCFGKPSHPTTAIEKDANQSHHDRDQVSALVVGLSGLGTLILIIYNINAVRIDLPTKKMDQSFVIYSCILSYLSEEQSNSNKFRTSRAARQTRTASVALVKAVIAKDSRNEIANGLS
ncbi:hypothetical protein K501DRAFT_276187 [Backusella circina FSU 941]|nr:hypothetical protein K501DRAFT_276187 [Backusella circina FSU 941]